MTSLRMRPLEFHEYMGSPVWKAISHRFYELHGIRIAEHVKSMLKVERGLGQGITFVPKERHELVRKLIDTGAFAHDDRDYLVDRAAAAVTQGEGYREIGPVSLHVAVAPERCNIHIDDYGFVGIGPDGKKYFNADLFQHIGDDLGIGFLREFFNKHAPPVGWMLERTHVDLPNSSNQYRKGIGAHFDIARGRSNNPEKRWALTLNVDHTCQDRWCQERATTWGVNLTVGRK